MSRAGSIAGASAASQTISLGTEPSQAIVLVDHTKDSVPSQAPGDPAVEQADQTRHSSEQGPKPTETLIDTDTPVSARAPGERELSRRFTKSSFQKSRAQRKYARYQEDRFVEASPRDPSTPVAPKGRRERGKTLVRDAWRGKKVKQHREEDAIIEVLYENQRGLFTFGFPHFSSKSLLNFDPKAWTNAHKRTSPVNITNAQVPDPNWEWAWKSWYVDMSRDVDEDGWEYSLAFYGCAWHGNHPWFHSFVRRRRWLRKRVRKESHHAKGRTPGQKHMSEAHMLTPDYFTIHPTKTRDVTERPVSIATSGSVAKTADTDEPVEAKEVSDIATLLVLLRRATIDREKIVLIRSFLHNATDELFYLKQEMHHIMSLLMFQNSRRDLLRLIMDELEAATQHRDMHRDEDKEEGEKERVRMDHLLAAKEAAEQEVGELQFWSDLRGMIRDGKTATGVDGNWDQEKWEGLEGSGPGLGGKDVKEEAKSREEIEQEVRDSEKKAYDANLAQGDVGEAKDGMQRVGYGQFDQKDEDEELPRVGPDNDVHRQTTAEPVDLDEYDQARGV